MKIKINLGDLTPVTDEDRERVKQLVVTALMMGGNGALAASLLISAIGQLAEQSDRQELVVEVAIRAMAEDLAPRFKQRVLAVCAEEGVLS